jgi:hypothetical protein
MGDGILTDGGSGDGILVHRNADNGILVHRNADDGVLVHRNADDGILVHRPDDDGILVHSTSMSLDPRSGESMCEYCARLKRYRDKYMSMLQDAMQNKAYFDAGLVKQQLYGDYYKAYRSTINYAVTMANITRALSKIQRAYQAAQKLNTRIKWMDFVAQNPSFVNDVFNEYLAKKISKTLWEDILPFATVSGGATYLADKIGDYYMKEHEGEWSNLSKDANAVLKSILSQKNAIAKRFYDAGCGEFMNLAGDQRYGALDE